MFLVLLTSEFTTVSMHKDAMIAHTHLDACVHPSSLLLLLYVTLCLCLLHHFFLHFLTFFVFVVHSSWKKKDYHQTVVSILELPSSLRMILCILSSLPRNTKYPQMR